MVLNVMYGRREKERRRIHGCMEDEEITKNEEEEVQLLCLEEVLK